MAKETGLGDNLYVDGFNLSGDIGAITSLSSPINTVPATGIDKEAMERLAAHVAGLISYQAFFNPETDPQAGVGVHPVLSNLPGADVLVTYCRGTDLGGPAAGLQAVQIGYDPTRANDGSLTIAVQAQSDETPLEWGRQLTAGVRTDTTATNGDGVDFGAATAFGLSAYLHVFSLDGDSLDVTIEDSADGQSWAALTDGAFATVTQAPEAQRLETDPDQAVRRHLRVVTSGVFSEAAFAVLAVKHEAEVLPW